MQYGLLTRPRSRRSAPPPLPWLQAAPLLVAAGVMAWSGLAGALYLLFSVVR